MSIRVCPFTATEAQNWDDFVSKSLAGNFLHTRRFLSYHGDRFQDVSTAIYDSKDLAGVFPAAADLAEPRCVTSHPGATYGGLVHDGALRGAKMLAAVEALRAYYRELGFRKMRYKAVPRIFQRAPADDDLYALFRVGARRYRCDLGAAIDLQHRLPPSSLRRRCIKAARAKGVTVVESGEVLTGFWSLLEDVLGQRHHIRPVHTLEEMRLLHARFPSCIRQTVALAGEEIVAGAILFLMPTVVHMQYSCASERGFHLHAMDALIQHCIGNAADSAARWLSMGISNESEGWVLNEGLYNFKVQFGGGGVAHEFYEMELL